MQILAELTNQMVCGEPGPNVYVCIYIGDREIFASNLYEMKYGDQFDLRKIGSKLINIENIIFIRKKNPEYLSLIENNTCTIFITDEILEKFRGFLIYNGNHNVTLFVEDDNQSYKQDANVIFELIVDAQKQQLPDVCDQS